MSGKCLDYIQNHNVEILSREDNGKAKLRCRKCGWKEIRNIYNTVAQARKTGFVCKSCRRITLDNETILRVKEWVEENGGLCLEQFDYTQRAQRKYTHKTKMLVNVCGHLNYLSYDDVLSGYTGRCNACAQGSLTNKEIIALGASLGIELDFNNIDRSRDRTYLVNFQYKCGHAGNNLKLSRLKQRKHGLCASCFTANRNRKNLKDTKEKLDKIISQQKWDIDYEIHIPQKGNTQMKFCCAGCQKISYLDLQVFFAAPSPYCHACRNSQCKWSCGEQCVKQWLDKHHINYEMQKSFNDLWGEKKKLRFDFYLTDNEHLREGLIEFDGAFHYQEQLLKINKKQKEYDNKKNNYCRVNNIPLLRIPYFKSTEMDNMLDDFITKLKDGGS